MATDLETPSTISIAPLLKGLSGDSHEQITADEIASAVALIFENQLSIIQCSSLLTLLHVTKRDREPDVIAKCAKRMREAAAQVDRKALRDVVKKKGKEIGSYRGGLCDIVGTGGDGHSTFNISTTASILASSLLLISKHGNRASSSTSGSADLLQSIAPRGPVIEGVTAKTLPTVYERTNYAFLFAPKFHPGMKHVAPIRKDLGFRTIFNILGPLANPVEGLIEARVVGVARRELGPIFAEALRLSGAKKALVVCGAEDLDEISCAGKTYCWRLIERPNPEFRGSRNEEDEDYTTSDEEAPPRMLVKVEEFQLQPSDFGFPAHPLSEVGPGRMPKENAETLMKVLKNEVPSDDPVLHFVLMNTAALFVMAGICDADTNHMGHGDDGKIITEIGPSAARWKEGVRRARWAIESGEALRSLQGYIEVTNSFDSF
ncbi:anthranilate phosphoribosyltransferase [Ptychographa xylographoides]|nr:anthranilate phosphoribosyltransferase [Ptychographa xylographoides]